MLRDPATVRKVEQANSAALALFVSGVLDPARSLVTAALRDGESDVLEGGEGSDTYYADANDTIIDSDGVGIIYYGAGNIQLVGGTREQNSGRFGLFRKRREPQRQLAPGHHRRHQRLRRIVFGCHTQSQSADLRLRRSGERV